MKRNRKLASALLGTAFVSSAILAGCGSGSSSTPLASTPGKNNPNGIYRELGNWSVPPQYQGNPFGSGGIGAAYYFTQAPLFEFWRYTDAIQNRLAASIDQSNPLKTIVKIRPDAKYNDGQPFTAKDVWAYYTLNDGAGLTKFLTGIKVIDPQTVEFDWINPAPFGEMKQLLLAQDWQDQIPYHIYKTYVDKAASILAAAPTDTDANDLGKYPFQKKLTSAQQTEWNNNWTAFTKDNPKLPVGTGPYVVSKVTANQMVLVPNKYFYGASSLKFKTVELSQVNDLNQQYALLKAGQLDRYDGTQPKDILESILASNKDLVHYQMYDPASVGFIFNVSRKPFDNITFRQALIYAIDRSKAQQVGNYYGKTTPFAATGMPPSVVSNYVDPSVQAKMTKFNYDPKKAAQLLESIGWKKNSSGQWEDPSGKVPNFSIASDGTWVPAVNAGEVVAEELTQFGLPTTYKAVDSSVYWSQVGQNNHKGDPYDMHFDWVDVTWGFTFPWSPEENFWTNTFAQSGWTLGSNGNPAYTAKDWNGDTVDPYALLQKLPYMQSAQDRTKAIEQLAYLANESATTVNLFQNVTGAWFNMKTIGGLPWPDGITKYNRDLPPPPAKYEQSIRELNEGQGGIAWMIDGPEFPN